MGEKSVLIICVMSLAMIFTLSSNCWAPPLCGDGVLGNGWNSNCYTINDIEYCEECDPGTPQDYGVLDPGGSCPGECLPDCTCPAEPICGDNKVNRPEEECDGTDDSACPGKCTLACTCPAGGEGCTPGYWKVQQHFDSWVGYSPNDLFSSVFENAFPGKTLLQVLWQGGGGLKALGRHTVAALLNASSPDVDYGMTAEEVIAAFNAVYPGGDYAGLKNEFEDLNEQGCPLD